MVLVGITDYLPLFFVDIIICLIRKFFLFFSSPSCKIVFMILRSIRFRVQSDPLLRGKLISRKQFVHDNSCVFMSFRHVSIIILS
ncbi:hypothetical protein NY2A_b063L [Paramecium bursaria Chlorella virus NY2A]|uniref:Uncharacterized protein b063L n=1 Tax=Paramecium bursaria Chlorella virus NY2A TaxID=46021 RepID=A7IVT8_PBCVN|nr:hypothetical protein NY2A_b063L [Paramecium bursaria Chlorella virus NY2A]ABT14462.1 hypothetical protein NY2A_b063L [Paramecium bursaria Chlorella virus NY2A]